MVTLPFLFLSVSLVHGLWAFDGLRSNIMEMDKDSAEDTYLSGHLLLR